MANRSMQLCAATLLLAVTVSRGLAAEDDSAKTARKQSSQHRSGSLASGIPAGLTPHENDADPDRESLGDDLNRSGIVSQPEAAPTPRQKKGR